MTVNLVKLSVGSDSVASLAAWQRQLMADRRADGLPANPVHITRQTPKRAEELLDGGSMYWVIKGQIAARQTIAGLEGVIGRDGLARCCIVLAPSLVATQLMPRKAFQGWRYLSVADAPADLSPIGANRRAGARTLPDHQPEALSEPLPEPLRRELMAIGAW